MTTTTIWVSKGEVEYVGGTVYETAQVDISSATFKIGLSTSETTPPDAFSVPDVSIADGASYKRTIKMLVDNTVSAGTYYAWGQIDDGTETAQVLLQGPIVVA